MDPVSGSVAGALLTKAAIPIAQGFAGFAQAKGEKERAEANAYIGRTRAIQTDTYAREGLNSEMASIRAALGANGQRPGVGTLAMMDELRRVRDSERRIQFGNRMSEAADWRRQAQNAGGQAFGSLAGGFLRAGPSLFTYQHYREKQKEWKANGWID